MDFARRPRTVITERAPRRVAALRSKAESVETSSAVEDRDKQSIEAVSSRPAIDASQIEGAQSRVLPQLLVPQLATLVESAPQTGDWVFEQKLDGYHMLCRVRNGEARIFTRNGHDWTAKLSSCAAAVEALGIKNAWLDGELVAFGAGGTTSFQALQGAFNGKPHAQLHYFLFDLPYLEGYDLTQAPLARRKKLLAALLKRTGGILRYSDHVEGHGQAFYGDACRAGLEGIIGKRRDAPYVHGRSTGWVKVKCRREQEFVIGGYSDPEGSRAAFGALLLGVHDDHGDLSYAGRVGTGFNERQLCELHKRLAPLERPRPLFVNPPKGGDARGVHWVEPKLVAEVKFAEWTGEGIVRQASFVGLREDKCAKAITREVAAAAVDRARPQPAAFAVTRRKGSRIEIRKSDAGAASGPGNAAMRRKRTPG